MNMLMAISLMTILRTAAPGAGAGGDSRQAEAYHQDYHRKNSMQYHRYHTFSGREGFIAAHWTDPAAQDGPAAAPAYGRP